MKNTRDRIMLLVPLLVSKKVAKARPICKPMNSPAACTTAKTTCMTRPMAIPMRICSAIRPTPAQDIIGTSGMDGRLGAMTKVISKASPILTWLGTLEWPHSGAAEKNARIRTKGHSKMTSQPCIWAKVISTMRSSPQERGSHHQHAGNVGKQRAREVDDQADQPGAGKDQHGEYPQDLGNERQCHFVNLGGGLEQADGKTGQHRGEQQWAGQKQRDAHALVGQAHDHFRCHFDSSPSWARPRQSR